MKGLKNVSAYVEGKGLIKTNLAFDNGKLIVGGNVTEEIAKLGEDQIVVPGFIDQHIHGAAGYDAMDGTQEALSGIAKAVAKEGTTGFLATTMTQSPANITKALAAVKDYRAAKSAEGAEVLGVHLEGPFISRKHIGAQPLEYVASPDVEVFKQYQRASGDNIRVVTFAVEEEGAQELAKYLASQHIVPSAGHTDAGFADVQKSVEWGVCNVTHTYNAQRALHHREAGTVGAAMMLDDLHCEMISDTIHVSVPAMQLLVKNKPAEKLILITDAIRAKGLPDGLSELGGQVVVVKDGQARLENGTLAGSVLKMNLAVKNVHTLVGLDLLQTIDCATINPARNLGLDKEMGSIATGKRANLAVLDTDFSVIITVRDGEIIYQR